VGNGAWLELNSALENDRCAVGNTKLNKEVNMNVKTFVVLSIIVVSVWKINAGTPSENPKSGLHVRNILVIYNNVYVSFEEDYCSRVYGDWQMRIQDLSNFQTKALYALLINAKNNGRPLSIWWSNGNASPSGVNDLTVIDGICER
jgi:hypothetical protein